MAKLIAKSLHNKSLKYSPEQIDQVAREQVIPLLEKYSIFTFTGPLGAGKTTLIRSILQQVGVTGAVTSPTFGYVNSYYTQRIDSQSRRLHGASELVSFSYNHFDLYRISSLDEFVMLGFDEYFAKKNSVSFVEWPDVINALLEAPEIRPCVCDIKIDYIANDTSSRVIKISARSEKP